MSDADDPERPDDPDRAAILARRQRFVTLALSGLTGAFAAGCDGGSEAKPEPCLDYSAPPETKVEGPTSDGQEAQATTGVPEAPATTGAVEGTSAAAPDEGTTGTTGASATTGASEPEGTGDETGGKEDTGDAAAPRPCLKKASPRPCLRKASPKPCLKKAPPQPGPQPCLEPLPDP